MIFNTKAAACGAQNDVFTYFTKTGLFWPCFVHFSCVKPAASTWHLGPHHLIQTIFQKAATKGQSPWYCSFWKRKRWVQICPSSKWNCVLCLSASPAEVGAGHRGDVSMREIKQNCLGSSRLNHNFNFCVSGDGSQHTQSAPKALCPQPKAVRADLTNQGDSIFGFDLFMLVSGGGLAGPVTQPLQTAFQCGACLDPSPGQGDAFWRAEEVLRLIPACCK